MTRKTLLGLALLAALPFAASAQNASGLNYNYVEGGYVATNLDNNDGDIDADGIGGNASFALSDNFHVFGGFNRQDSDRFDFLGSRVKTDVDQWRLGVGYNHAIGQSTDLVARAAYEKFEVGDVTVGGQRYAVNDGDDGYSAEVGVRTAFTSNFEGHAYAGYQDFGSGNDDFYGRVGALVKFNDNWGVSGDVKIADGGTEWFVGPRFSW